MNIPRAAVVLLGLAVIGLATVHLRARQVQQVHRIQRLQAEQTRLQQTLWSHQLEKARLSAPERIRSRAEQLDLVVMPPHDAGQDRPERAVASRRIRN
jgi:cell division protein FtsL